MNQTQIELVVVVAASAVTFVQIVPQVLRLLRIRRIEGTSPAWAAIGTAINVGWIAYVVAEQLWYTIPAVLAGAASYGLVLFLLYRNGADVRIGILLGLAVGAASVAIQLGAGWTVLGTVLGLSNGLYLGPSVFAAWRSHAPVGVSPLTWMLVASEGILWGFYGVLVAKGPIIVYGSTAAALAALVLLRLWITRHRIRAALAPPG